MHMFASVNARAKDTEPVWLFVSLSDGGLAAPLLAVLNLNEPASGFAIYNSFGAGGNGQALWRLAVMASGENAALWIGNSIHWLALQPQAGSGQPAITALAPRTGLGAGGGLAFATGDRLIAVDESGVGRQFAGAGGAVITSPAFPTLPANVIGAAVDPNNSALVVSINGGQDQVYNYPDLTLRHTYNGNYFLGPVQLYGTDGVGVVGYGPPQSGTRFDLFRGTVNDSVASRIGYNGVENRLGVVTQAGGRTLLVYVVVSNGQLVLNVINLDTFAVIRQWVLGASSSTVIADPVFSHGGRYVWVVAQGPDVSFLRRFNVDTGELKNAYDLGIGTLPSGEPRQAFVRTYEVTL